MTENFRKSDKNHKEAKPENKFQVCIYLYKKKKKKLLALFGNVLTSLQLYSTLEIKIS